MNEGDEFGVGGVKSEGRWKSIGFRLSPMRDLPNILGQLKRFSIF